MSRLAIHCRDPAQVSTSRNPSSSPPMQRRPPTRRIVPRHPIASKACFGSSQRIHWTPCKWGPPFSVIVAICGTTSRGNNPVYYVWWLQSTIPIARLASSTALDTPSILGSTANAPIGRWVFLNKHNIHWCWGLMGILWQYGRQKEPSVLSSLGLFGGGGVSHRGVDCMDLLNLINGSFSTSALFIK